MGHGLRCHAPCAALIGARPGPLQIKNDVLRELIADLEAERVPKVTVKSSVEFKGAVWE